MEQICEDLRAEHDDLDAKVAGLAEAEFGLPTPALGWSVRDQLSHLWFFDQRALMALTDPEAFAEDTRRLMSEGGTEASVQPGRSMSGAELVEAWRADRADLIRVARALDPSSRVSWYGPSMGARSFITARLMETWAHGQDIVDALGVRRMPTARLRHVAHIGVRAQPFSFLVHGREMPEAAIHVVLRGPDGDEWTWGEPAADSVRGEALDFCLVVTQRRHVADTDLVIEGPAAEEWMGIAQAFAGEPGTGRRPGQFPR